MATCVLGPDSPNCGWSSTYSNEPHCRGDACRDAWRVYLRNRRRKRPFELLKRRVWSHEHGTLACFREGCRCGLCIKAEWLDLVIRQAEDQASADEPQRLSSFALREPHGMSRAGYKRGCRCELCRIQNTIEQAQRRGSATVRRLQLRRATIEHERRCTVNARLAADPVIAARGGASYEMLETLPEQAAARNFEEAAARNLGLETL